MLLDMQKYRMFKLVIRWTCSIKMGNNSLHTLFCLSLFLMFLTDGILIILIPNDTAVHR